MGIKVTLPTEMKVTVLLLSPTSRRDRGIGYHGLFIVRIIQAPCLTFLLLQSKCDNAAAEASIEKVPISKSSNNDSGPSNQATFSPEAICPFSKANPRHITRKGNK